MDQAPAAPALPWGNQQQTASQQPTQQEGSQQQASQEEAVALPLDAVALHEGARIQVRWEVTLEIDNEDGTKEQKQSTKWWPAVVVGPAPEGEAPPEDNKDATASTQPQQHVYIIEYEQFETFQSERSKVVFTSAHSFVDVEKEGDEILVWRLEGDTTEYKLEDEEEESDEEEKAYTAEELAQIMAQKREAGEDAEEAFLENLEPAQQREVAEGYRAFIDGFKDFIANKVTPGGTVTAEDVWSYKNEMTEQLSKKRRQN